MAIVALSNGNFLTISFLDHSVAFHWLTTSFLSTGMYDMTSHDFSFILLRTPLQSPFLYLHNCVIAHSPITLI